MDIAPDAALPTAADIAAAAGRIGDFAKVTPVLRSDALDARAGARLLIKAEVLQRTGSFKIRGAANHITQLSRAALDRGVLAYSSGNHAQAVACAAARVGSPAVIVMPADAPRIKIARTRGFGAEVVLYDRYTENREALGARIAAERGLTLIPPYDHPWTIAGGGTLGLELAGQAAELGVVLDALVVCCGGGGLIAGCGLAMAERSPATRVYAVEPAGFDDTARSLAAGERQAVDPAARSICDALLSPSPGELTFALNRRHLAGGLTVTDAEAADAMRAAFAELKLVVEPGGAVALAAALNRRLPGQADGDLTVGVVLTGGNVDPSLYAEVLTAAL
ncbi:MAG: pyridoxal-phosphate dependent enzyme [Rhodospirillaceae bacterium]|nr:pyridoxal-phosphate dependent enzyme [Rhodospirillaceae bacterium]